MILFRNIFLNRQVIPSLEFQFTNFIISANSCEVLGEKNQYLKYHSGLLSSLFSCMYIFPT